VCSSDLLSWGLEHLEQIARVSSVDRGDAPATPLNRMTLNVEGANGVNQQVTVDLRGNTVSTQITTDAATADRMRLRTADLQEALGRHGLEADSVRSVESSRRMAPTPPAP
jgi:hypothetical protein